MLEASKSLASYILLVSAQDIPNTNSWDEDPPSAIPVATLWPEITDAPLDDAYFSNAWQALVEHFKKVSRDMSCSRLEKRRACVGDEHRGTESAGLHFSTPAPLAVSG